MAIKINGVEVIDDSRNVTTNVGTVDGRNVSSDGTKLDGVATGADVTADNIGTALTGLSTHADPDSSDLLAIYDDSASTWKKATITAAALQGDKGQKGEVGLTGTTGSAGAKGQKGEVGAAGANGATGSTGATGGTGAKGQKGEVGSTGGTGAKGQKGEVGASGGNGAKGQKGEVGVTGANGATGAKGQKGEVGAQGIQGNTGSTGSTGSTGQKGQKGQNGSTGGTGATGQKGQKGEVGQKGQTGGTGGTGATGQKGQKGEVGQKGATGGTGGTGGTGAKGQKGQKGQTGATGGTGGTGGTGAKGQKGQKGQTGAGGGTGATGAKGQKGDNAVTATSVTFGSGVTLQESTDRADLLQITSSTSGWGGLQIRNSSNEGRWSFMTDGSTAGIYDDENGDWHMQMAENGGVTLYANGTANFTTGTSYMEMARHLDMNNYDIYGVDQIFHHGDTNTYMQFHASDQWRVVTGGTERLEVNNDTMNVAANIEMNSHYLDMNNNDIYGVDIMRHHSDTDTYIGFPTDGKFSVVTDNSTRLEINAYVIDCHETVQLRSGITGDGSSLTGVAKQTNGVFSDNGQYIGVNYTVPTSKNAMCAGPVKVNSGITVTVGVDESWTVV